MKNAPAWSLQLPWNVITATAKENDLDPLLVAAVIMAESSGKQWETRYEPNYRWLHKPELFVPAYDKAALITEEIHQKTSWGCMQVMGAVAREWGFKAEMPKLCIWTIGVNYGCKHLRFHLKRWGNIPDAIAGYNAGAPRDTDKDGLVDNHKHVNRVLKFYTELGGVL